MIDYAQRDHEAAGSACIPRSLTGGQIVVATLAALGVRHIFGVPGGQTLAINDAIAAEPRIDFVTTHHENAAACMADAVGRFSRAPGVCLATAGPGATNLLTGIGGAFRDSSPVLALTCNGYNEHLDLDDAQSADHVQIFRALTKWATQVTEPSAIAGTLVQAWIRASSGCPGPVLVDLTRSALEGMVASPPLPELRPELPRAAAPDRGAVARAAALLRDARFPLMWLGNGARLAGAGETALQLAERMHIPVITTYNGTGTVPTTHPAVLGTLSRMGTELTTRALAECDVLLAVGNSFSGVSTARWSLPMPSRIIQVDIDPAMLGRYYPDRTIGVPGDARAVLAALISEVGTSRAGPAGNGATGGTSGTGGGAAQESRRGWMSVLAERRATWRRLDYAGPAGTGALGPAELVLALRELLPDETVMIADAGNPGVWTHLWEIPRPDTYFKPVGFGNMGFALPAAIGLRLAAGPGLPIVALVGDGSLGMSLAELETLARVGGPVAVIVMNDSGFGNIRQAQELRYGRTAGVDFLPIDFAAAARACRVPGARVTDRPGLISAVTQGLAGGGPFLVDALIDTTHSAWAYPAFQPFRPADADAED
jgi:acetolactate synthase-1/2/3 large subunit